jgi:Family of unknown function (DUF6152)
MKTNAFLFLVSLIVLTEAMLSHHSISGAYIVGREITVEGIVKEFHFVNPHPFLLVEVRNANGSGKTWKFEMDNRFELADVGIKNDTFKAGNRIVVTGNPATEDKESLYIRKLERPSDGFRLEQIESSPRITSKPR